MPGGGGETPHFDRPVREFGRPVAELAVLVPSPAFDVATGAKGTRVFAPGRHLRGVGDAFYCHRRSGLGVFAIAELALPAVAPAFEMTGDQECA